MPRPFSGRTAWLDQLALATAAGFLAGYLDAAALAVRRAFIQPFVFVGRNAVWTAPVVDAGIFLLIGAGMGALGTLTGRPVWKPSLWIYGFLAWSGVLYSFPQVDRVAGLVLAAGAATLLLRWAARRPEGLPPASRRLAASLLTGTALVAAGMIGWQRRVEAQALAGLPAAPAGAPNILLIVLDTVRAMNLSLYGYARPTTPALERWATEGVRFTRAFATAPWTLPSHASLLTGRQAHELTADWMVPLDAAGPTLAQVLGARGYRTGGFVGNTDYCSAEVGLDRGFSHYEDYTLTPGQVLRSSALGRAIGRVRALRAVLGNYDNLGRKTAAAINGAFLAWLDRGQRGRPFFAFLNLYDAHRPYLPPEPYASRFRTPGVPLHPRAQKENGGDPHPGPARIQGAIDAYDNSLTYLDAELGKLFRELERRGLERQTVVVLTADHGEEFVEHGVWDHGSTLYLASLQVPLVIVAPGRAPAGWVIATPVSLRDVAATITDFALGPDASPLPGRSLRRRWLPEFAGEGPEPVVASVRRVPRQPAWYPVTRGDMVSVAWDSLRYIRNWGDGVEEIYDYITDPREQTDLIGSARGAAALPVLRRQVAPAATTGRPGSRR